MLAQAKPPKAFTKWLASSRSEIETEEETEKASGFSTESFMDLLSLERGSGISLVADENLWPIEFESRRRVRPTKIMLARGDTPIIFRNITISRLHLLVHAGIACSVALKDCWINLLIMDASRNKVGLALRFDNTWLGSMRIKLDPAVGAISELRMQGGGVLHIEHEEGSFKGDVTLQKVFLPRRDGMYKNKPQSPQKWRNLRSEMMRLHNISAAGRFQISELSLERQQSEDRIYRFFSWVYEAFSDFGNSVAKPLSWLLILAGLMSLIYFVGDAFVPAESLDFANWRSIFLRPRIGPAVVALYAGVEPIVNPLGAALGSKTLDATHIIWLAVQTSYRVMSLILIFLFLLALRRRFRLSGT